MNIREEFDSYLSSYLLHYLTEEITKKIKNVEIHSNNNAKDIILVCSDFILNPFDNSKAIPKDYFIYY